jgi:negative regulator of flagellin synthesis FlgM
MIMKIDSSYKTTTAPLTQRPQVKTPAETVSTAATEVNLSPLAGALHVSEKPPVNLARIQEIKDAIAQGKFKINPEVIAGRLIETAKDLVNAQRHA